MSRVAAPGAVSRKSTTTGRPPSAAGTISMYPPPPMFPAAGQVTASAAAVATAASVALPPRFRISRPTSDAIPLTLTTMPLRPRATSARPARPQPPARDPNTPGYVKAKELPDGDVPPADQDGDFIIGPTHKRAPEMAAQDGVPKGKVFDLTMKSQDSKFYPGIARDPGAL